MNTFFKVVAGILFWIAVYFILQAVGYKDVYHDADYWADHGK